MEIKLSYIVPVYNVKTYLERCVDSIIDQNISNYEIILVDDGSTDGSSELVDQYERDFTRIKAIHKANGGLSSARNAGIKEAKGKYILFVDSDDYLKSDTVLYLIEAAEKYDLDVGVADFQYVYENGESKLNEILPFHTDEVISGEDFFLYSLQNRCTLKMVWKSIYRTDFLIDNDLYFREGYNHEDEEWTPRVYLKARRIKDIQIVFYNYLIRNSSISQDSKAFAKNSLDLVSNCYELKKLSFTVENKELKNLFQDRTAGIFLSAVYKGNLVNKEYSDLVNVGFFKGLYLEKNTKIKVALFKISKKLYCMVNRITKKQ